MKFGPGHLFLVLLVLHSTIFPASRLPANVANTRYVYLSLPPIYLFHVTRQQGPYLKRSFVSAGDGGGLSGNVHECACLLIVISLDYLSTIIYLLITRRIFTFFLKRIATTTTNIERIHQRSAKIRKNPTFITLEFVFTENKVIYSTTTTEHTFPKCDGERFIPNQAKGFCRSFGQTPNKSKLTKSRLPNKVW